MLEIPGNQAFGKSTYIVAKKDTMRMAKAK